MRYILSNKKFVICWPRPEGQDVLEFFEKAQSESAKKAKQVKFSHDKDLYSVPEFYTTLESVLDELGLKHERMYGTRYRVPLKVTNDKIYLCYHSHSENMRNNVWHVHTSGLVGHFTIDRKGYAGYSEPASTKNYFEISQSIDLTKSREFFDKFSTEFINTNTSRQYQPEMELDIDEPYVFLAGQLSYDSVVANLSYINPPQEYYNTIAEVVNCKVVYKRHPAELVEGKTNKLSMPRYPNVIPYTGSIHTAIKNAMAVYVINSGVGFEALLHKKRVFTAGKCDYYPVTNVLKNLNDVKNSVGLLDQPIDEDALVRYMYHLINDVYVNVYSRKSIRDKILQIVEMNK